MKIRNWYLVLFADRSRLWVQGATPVTHRLSELPAIAFHLRQWLDACRIQYTMHGELPTAPVTP